MTVYQPSEMPVSRRAGPALGTGEPDPESDFDVIMGQAPEVDLTTRPVKAFRVAGPGLVAGGDQGPGEYYSREAGGLLSAGLSLPNDRHRPSMQPGGSGGECGYYGYRGVVAPGA